MVQITSSVGGVGTSVATAEIEDNAVTLAKLAGGTAAKYIGFDGSGDPAELGAPGVNWTLLDTVTFSSDTTKTTATLDAYNEYLLIYRLDSAGAGDLHLRINGDTTGTAYHRFYIDNVTFTASLSSDKIILGTMDDVYPIVGMVHGDGLAHGGTNTRMTYSILSGISNFAAGGNKIAMRGTWNPPSDTEQVTDFTIFCASALTGTLWVYGR